MEMVLNVVRLCGLVEGHENEFKAVETFLSEPEVTVIRDNKDDPVLGEDESVLVVTPDYVDLQTYRRMEQAKLQNKRILFWDGERINTQALIKFYGFQIANPEQAPVLNPGRFGLEIKTSTRPRLSQSFLYRGANKYDL